MEAPPGPEPMELDAPPPAAAEAAASVPPAGSEKVSSLCPDLGLGSDLRRWSRLGAARSAASAGDVANGDVRDGGGVRGGGHERRRRAGGFPHRKATVVQVSSVFFDTSATIEKAKKLIAEAAKQGAQLVVFPEVFVGGFPHGSDFGVTIGGPPQAKGGKGKDLFCKYYASSIDVPGPETNRLASFAAEYRVYLVTGAVERHGRTLYNTVLFFSPAGELLGKPRKPFCRRKDYPPPPEYAFTGFDEEPAPDDDLCRGGSVIVSPSGAVLAGPKYDGEGLLTADLDFSEIVRAKFDFDVVGHSSRPEVLTLVVQDQPQLPVVYTSASPN
ncbi:unnamed protein product [Miscanthus lutarioriparius]|uniref:CN hydrolase domain-containing protein n=1 Tax=Miscanthus lutarioriparius TaxID=422564 RepID=A0A811QVK2_9POAL|nr:unnamed protein product [Miscanthus lutarioriparius]